LDVPTPPRTAGQNPVLEVILKSGRVGCVRLRIAIRIFIFIRTFEIRGHLLLPRSLSPVNEMGLKAAVFLERLRE
jgi:hypothetical protein